MTEAAPLWAPSEKRIASAPLTAFKAAAASLTGQEFLHLRRTASLVDR